MNSVSSAIQSALMRWRTKAQRGVVLYQGSSHARSLYGMIVYIMPFKIFLDLCLFAPTRITCQLQTSSMGVALAGHFLINILTGFGEGGTRGNAAIAGAMERCCWWRSRTPA